MLHWHSASAKAQFVSVRVSVMVLHIVCKLDGDRVSALDVGQGAGAAVGAPVVGTAVGIEVVGWAVGGLVDPTVSAHASAITHITQRRHSRLIVQPPTNRFAHSPRC